MIGIVSRREAVKVKVGRKSRRALDALCKFRVSAPDLNRPWRVSSSTITRYHARLIDPYSGGLSSNNARQRTNHATRLKSGAI
jgi:hypothetical protein